MILSGQKTTFLYMFMLFKNKNKPYMEAAKRKEGDNCLSRIAIEKNHFLSITTYPKRK